MNLNRFEKNLVQDLLECISKGQYDITYGKLTEKYGVDPHGKHVANALGNMSKLCYELGLPLISVMVVRQDTTFPSWGFKGLCDELSIHQDKTENELIQYERRNVKECTEWWKLAEHLGLSVKGIEKPVLDPAETIVQTEGIEGKMIQVNSTVYERDRKLREACIRKYGTRCAICGFDAGQIYGSEFDGWIHVHHVIALSEIGSEHTTIVETDLIPVCPNCHMVLHAKKDGVYSPEEVREMIKNNGGNNGMR